jgi:hypothetical protein
MDRDVDALTMLLMDPFLTRDEAEREAAASAPAAWGRNEPSVFEADTESGDR